MARTCHENVPRNVNEASSAGYSHREASPERGQQTVDRNNFPIKLGRTLVWTLQKYKRSSKTFWGCFASVVIQRGNAQLKANEATNTKPTMSKQQLNYDKLEQKQTPF